MRLTCLQPFEERLTSDEPKIYLFSRLCRLCPFTSSHARIHTSTSPPPYIYMTPAHPHCHSFASILSFFLYRCLFHSTGQSHVSLSGHPSSSCNFPTKRCMQSAVKGLRGSASYIFCPAQATPAYESGWRMHLDRPPPPPWLWRYLATTDCERRRVKRSGNRRQLYIPSAWNVESHGSVGCSSLKTKHITAASSSILLQRTTPMPRRTYPEALSMARQLPRARPMRSFMKRNARPCSVGGRARQDQARLRDDIGQPHTDPLYVEIANLVPFELVRIQITHARAQRRLPQDILLTHRGATIERQDGQLAVEPESLDGTRFPKQRFFEGASLAIFWFGYGGESKTSPPPEEKPSKETQPELPPDRRACAVEAYRDRYFQELPS